MGGRAAEESGSLGFLCLRLGLLSYVVLVLCWDWDYHLSQYHDK